MTEEEIKKLWRLISAAEQCSYYYGMVTQQMYDDPKCLVTNEKLSQKADDRKAAFKELSIYIESLKK